jgi:hypothetical protein
MNDVFCFGGFRSAEMDEMQEKIPPIPVGGASFQPFPHILKLKPLHFGDFFVFDNNAHHRSL